MRTTARIAIEKAPKRARVRRSPLTGTGMLCLLLLVGAALLTTAFAGH